MDGGFAPEQGQQTLLVQIDEDALLMLQIKVTAS